jgi:hypothetical protein
MSPRRTSVEGSDTMSPASNDHKRKGDDGAPQPRAKRNRYISIAWYDDVYLGQQRCLALTTAQQ